MHNPNSPVNAIHETRGELGTLWHVRIRGINTADAVRVFVAVSALAS